MDQTSTSRGGCEMGAKGREAWRGEGARGGEGWRRNLFSCTLLPQNQFLHSTDPTLGRSHPVLKCGGSRGGGQAFKPAIEATPCLGNMAGQQNVPSPSTSHLRACFLKFPCLQLWRDRKKSVSSSSLQTWNVLPSYILCKMIKWWKDLGFAAVEAQPPLSQWNLPKHSSPGVVGGESVFPHGVHDLYNIAGFFFFPPLYAEQPTASVCFLLKKENLNLFFKKKKSLSIVILHEASYIIQQDA